VRYRSTERKLPVGIGVEVAGRLGREVRELGYWAVITGIFPLWRQEVERSSADGRDLEGRGARRCASVAEGDADRSKEGGREGGVQQSGRSNAVKQAGGGAIEHDQAAVGMEDGDADGFACFAVRTGGLGRRRLGGCGGAGPARLGLGNGSPGKGNPGAAEVVGEQTIVTNLGEGTGEQMLTKAPHKGPGGEGRRLLHAMVGVVTIGEGDGVCFCIKALDATLADGDAVGVVAEVREDGGRTRKGRTAVHDPAFGFAELTPQFGPASGRSGHRALLAQGGQSVQELAAKDRTHRTDRKQVVAGLDRLPAARRTEGSAGDNAVDVGMQRELLSPRVQDRGDADLAPKPFATQAQEHLRGGLEKQGVHLPRVAGAKGKQHMGQRADDVEVGRFQQIALLALKPDAGQPTLTLGTVPVAAASGDGLDITTIRTRVEQVPEFAGAAAHQGAHGGAVDDGHGGTVAIERGAQDLAKKGGHRGRAAIRSSGWARVWMRPWVTCR